MGCLGVHFGLTEEQLTALRSQTDESARLAYLQEELEVHFFESEPNFKAESDKSWDALHRSLADGQLTYTSGPEPLRYVVLGGEPLFTGEEYIMSLKTRQQVKAVAEALPNVTPEVLRLGYDRISEEDYGLELSDEDFEYTWQWFVGIREFWLRADNAGRYVLFTADQ